MFDASVVGGRSVMGKPLHTRSALLADLLVDVPYVKLVDQVIGHGQAMYRAAVELGLEGIVAKRLDSSYHPGLRSRDWLKIKRPGAVPVECFKH